MEFSPQVFLDKTPELENILSELKSKPKHKEFTTRVGETLELESKICFDDAKEVVRMINVARNEEGGDRVLFSHVFSCSRASVPTKAKVIPPNPDKEKRMARLRAEFERQDYMRMVGKGGHQILAEKKFEHSELRSYTSQMSIGANIIITMGTCFTLMYYLGRQRGYDTAWCSVLGIFGLIFAMLLETTLFVIRANEIDKRTAKENAKKEKKAAYNIAAVPN